MSHFTVAVFTEPNGKTLEELLAPFDENIEMERYILYTKEELIEKGKLEIEEYATNGCYAEYLKDPIKYEEDCKNECHLNYIKNVFPLKLKWTNEEIYQDQIKYYDEEEIGENGEVYSTYNPNSKWDWYQIGGRWSGLLKLKDGAFGKMGERSWATKDDDIAEDMVDMAKVRDVDWESMNDFITYAVITPDGKWHSKGEMGWFGFSSESKNEAELWKQTYKQNFIDTANPEWTITIVDCHI